MPTVLAPHSTILFIGDSITDCGRFEPQHRPLGCGYVRMFADMLTVREPQKHVTVINRGIGGNAAEDLRSRWHDDVVWHKPDWLSVKIGINDINHWLCGVKPELRSPEAFARIYDQVLALTRTRLPSTQILLIEPFYMSRDTDADSYRAKVLAGLTDYIAVVHTMHKKYGTRLVRAQELFNAALEHNHPQVFGDEPVHPNATGHLLIAEAVYAALN